jgi:hypothetical protein
MLRGAKISVSQARFFCLLLFLLVMQNGRSEKRIPPLVNRVFSFVDDNQLKIGHLDSKIYFKFHMQNERKNIAMRLIPFIGRQERGKHSYFGESAFKFSYTAPGILDKKQIALYSTMPYLRNLQDLMVASVNMTIYQPTLLRDRILSPMNKRNKKYYRYRLDSTFYEDGRIIQRIRISPRIFNMQLVKGYMDVVSTTGEVRRFVSNFNYNTQHFTTIVELGENGLEKLLPKHIKQYYNFNFFKNSSSCFVDIFCNYENVLPYDEEAVKAVLKKNGFDLTFLNKLNTDSTETERNVSFFKKERPLPLTFSEDSIYKVYTDGINNQDTVKVAEKKPKNIFSESLEDLFLGSHYVHFGSRELLRLPPIITPSMLEWSNRKGLSLKAQIRLTCALNKGRQLITNLHLGYNFRKNEFYWKTPTDLLFAPKHNGVFHVEVGNGNKTYNSDQAEEVRKHLSNKLEYDSLLNAFNRYTFNYYNDFFAKTSVSYELINGLTGKLGLVYHERKLTNWNEEAGKNGINKKYRSLAPNIYLEWTPGLYYYWRKERKQKLFTKWPTFSAEYERGVTAFNCHNKYERWEFETKQKINLYALRSLYLRMGGGFYTRKTNTYFVDYSNFHYNSLPSSWLDEMNGQFEALDSRWYNESEYYARACISYESPMLIFSRIKPLTQYIKRERIYCNLLSVHALNPYVEMGYSISTHLFDAGIFMGSSNNKGGISFGWNFALRFFENN